MTTKEQMGWTLACFWGLLTPLQAASYFTIDATRSRVSLTLSLQGKEDTEESPLSGFFQLAWQPRENAQDIQLLDYRISTTRGLTFLLNYGILGRIDATLDSLTLIPPLEGVQVVNGRLEGAQALLTNFVSYARGGGQYVATGIPCTVLKSFGRECTDTFDFDDEPPRSTPEVTGTLQKVGDVYELVLTYPVEQALDPQAPDLGALRGQATMIATAEVTPDLLATLGSNGAFNLAWPSTYLGYKLQSASVILGNPIWNDVGLEPTLDAGMFKVSIPVQGSQSYYRLIKTVAQ